MNFTRDYIETLKKRCLFISVGEKKFIPKHNNTVIKLCDDWLEHDDLRDSAHSFDVLEKNLIAKEKK